MRRSEKRLCWLSGACRSVWLLCFLHGVDQPDELLGSMGYGNVIVLTFSPLLGKVGGKGWIMDTDILGGVENGIAQVSGASFLHVGIAVGQLPRLVG